MQLKVTPKVDARYWTAILIASMCGTNFGDFFPDELGLSAGASFAILALMFTAIVLVDGLLRRGSESCYWLAILTVRAAATIIADYTIGQKHLGYGLVSAVLALALSALIFVYRRGGPRGSTGDLPPTTGIYWSTMLMAGALGTVIGDGVGHAFGPVQIGVPVSAAMATVALAVVLGARAKLAWQSAASYWTAVVAVRWWGTNVGDILKFLLSIGVSMTATGVALALVLLIWREPVTRRGDDAGALRT